MSKLTDSELVRMVLAGKAELFGLLMQRYWERVRGVINWLLTSQNYIPSYGDIEDAIHKTFRQARRDLGNFDQERPFLKWLLGIAHNRAVDILRKRQRQFVSLDAMPEVKREKTMTSSKGSPVSEATTKAEEDPAKLFAEETLKDMFWVQMRKLPLKVRLPVVLRLKDRSYPYIAKRLNCTAAQAKYAVKQGLRALLSLYLPQSLLNRLPRRQRLAVAMRCFRDRLYPEIAESLDCSVKEAERLVSQGLMTVLSFYLKTALD